MTASRSCRCVLSLQPMEARSTLRELWDSTRMRLLVEIERQGSLSGAAAAIGIGQPSASQHLRLLEAAAGQRLVERGGGRHPPTPARQNPPGAGAPAPVRPGAAPGGARAPPRAGTDEELRAIGVRPAGVWELGSSEGIKRAAREGLGLAFLSRYAVAEEVARGDLESFRLAGRPPLNRQFSIAHLAGRPLSPAEQGFIATLTSCCAKQADYAAACVGAPRRTRRRATD